MIAACKGPSIPMLPSDAGNACPAAGSQVTSEVTRPCFMVWDKLVLHWLHFIWVSLQAGTVSHCICTRSLNKLFLRTTAVSGPWLAIGVVKLWHIGACASKLDAASLQPLHHMLATNTLFVVCAAQHDT